LFVTPAINASVNVQTLAVLFNMDVADVKIRKIMVDEFPIPNAVALLTTEDFFVCHDTLYENTSFWNAQTLATNYYLHHWGIYSVSPFVPAILFTTDAGTVVNKITQTVSGIEVTAADATVKPGETVQLNIELQGTIAPTSDAISVKPDSATYAVELTSETEGNALNARTYVDNYGVLHVQKTGISAGDSIKVTATATYINPSGATSEYTDDVTVTVA